jgi:hypothetical protein
MCVCMGHRGGDARKSLLDKLQGYDYDPSAQPDEVYPDDSASQVADDDHRVSDGTYCPAFHLHLGFHLHMSEVKVPGIGPTCPRWRAVCARCDGGMQGTFRFAATRVAL